MDNKESLTQEEAIDVGVLEVAVLAVILFLSVTSFFTGIYLIIGFVSWLFVGDPLNILQ